MTTTTTADATLVERAAKSVAAAEAHLSAVRGVAVAAALRARDLAFCRDEHLLSGDDPELAEAQEQDITARRRLRGASDAVEQARRAYATAQRAAGEAEEERVRQERLTRLRERSPELFGARAEAQAELAALRRAASAPGGMPNPGREYQLRDRIREFDQRIAEACGTDAPAGAVTA